MAGNLPVVSLGSASGLEYLLNRAEEEISQLKKKGLGVDYRVDNRGKFTFLSFYLSKASGRGHAVLRSCLSRLVADVVLSPWQDYLIRKMIKNYYYYFSPSEREAICQKVTELLGRRGTTNHRQAIISRVRDYLGSHDTLVIEGFIHFRLPSYIEQLEKVVDEAVDDFIIEKEYRDFIRLLQYFVEMQEPKVEMVHVVVGPGERFQLLDAQGQALDAGPLLEVNDPDLTYEDLMLSALITVAPKAVTLHLKDAQKDFKTAGTIMSVFGSRVTTCSGCWLCRHSGQKKRF